MPRSLRRRRIPQCARWNPWAAILWLSRRLIHPHGDPAQVRPGRAWRRTYEVELALALGSKRRVELTGLIFFTWPRTRPHRIVFLLRRVLRLAASMLMISTVGQRTSQPPRSRACAKLLVRSGLRCGSCFDYRWQCNCSAISPRNRKQHLTFLCDCTVPKRRPDAFAPALSQCQVALAACAAPAPSRRTRPRPVLRRVHVFPRASKQVAKNSWHLFLLRFSLSSVCAGLREVSPPQSVHHNLLAGPTAALLVTTPLLSSWRCQCGK